MPNAATQGDKPDVHERDQDAHRPSSTVKEFAVNHTLTEAQLRSRYRARGLGVSKSRARNLHINDQGGYMLFDIRSNTVVDGVNFDLTLDELCDALPDWEFQRDRSWAI